MLNKYKKAVQPFHFCTRLNLRELTGLRARNLRELVEIIKTVSGSCIFHHTHVFLQQNLRLSPERPNDFAFWVTERLGEYKLGEELASIDILEYSSIRELRETIISIIQKNLFEKKESLRIASKGKEFEFIKSHSFILPTPYSARNLSQFIKILRKVSINSIYFHVFEARLRLEKGINDFSYWLGDSLNNEKLADRISALDPYTHTLERLRESIIEILEKG